MKNVIIKQVSTSKEFEAITRLRKIVYTRWGYLENGYSEVDIDEFDLKSRSVHFVAYYSREIVGTIRLIFARKSTLPIEKEFSLKKQIVHRAHAVEVSRMASNNHAEKFFKDQRIMLGLIRAIHDYAIEHDVLDWYAAIDSNIYDRFFRMGIRWKTIGRPRIYLGSTTIPAFLHLPDAMQQLHELNPHAWKQIANGHPGVIIR